MFDSAKYIPRWIAAGGGVELEMVHHHHARNLKRFSGTLYAVSPRWRGHTDLTEGLCDCLGGDDHRSVTREVLLGNLHPDFAIAQESQQFIRFGRSCDGITLDCLVPVERFHCELF